MATRGFLIRFIDIGLIVLFGFLMISDIDASTRVDLAGTASEVEEPEDQEETTAYLVVDVTPSGAFEVVDPLIEDSGVTVQDVESLVRVLSTLSAVHQQGGLETVVLIQPHAASPVQATVHVMDACDRLSLAKSLRMDLEIESVPSDPAGSR